MATEIIKIRKKKNHSVMRDIKVSSIKSFTKFGWEIVPNTEGIQVTAKKKDVEPAVSRNEAGLSVNPIKSYTDALDEAELIEARELREEVIEGAESAINETAQPTIESLRDEYETITGKTADKRWSLKRISDELEKLK